MARSEADVHIDLTIMDGGCCPLLAGSVSRVSGGQDLGTAVET